MGIDISKKMVEKARALDRGYTKLLVGDIDRLLAMPAAPDDGGGAASLGAATFDLVLCTDTFVYYGDLCEVFRLVAARLAPSASPSAPPSLFVVTLERLPEDEAAGEPWRLQKTGTYVHTTRHVEDAAARAGLQIELHKTDYSPRLENEVPVKGQMAVLRRKTE